MARFRLFGAVRCVGADGTGGSPGGSRFQWDDIRWAVGNGRSYCRGGYEPASHTPARLEQRAKHEAYTVRKAVAFHSAFAKKWGKKWPEKYDPFPFSAAE
ncbi:UDP-Gal:betaGlcNAc beta 1,3-galactosyltransferase 1-like protein [Anopheles sinensis]|uniref:UDP-Gal:betaGlcNAc beta 1,3-galactosyltransferase 1-like protein n=1 Tax=Anopheles sinensis TaxID=74873 RepID=A0A084W335_ANOSI|nr:UDP-Gal:betaGlcNAc beta 1,3-galactosyltransferase 1-like protein [Anopheles sinensis]